MLFVVEVFLLFSKVCCEKDVSFCSLVQKKSLLFP